MCVCVCVSVVSAKSTLGSRQVLGKILADAQLSSWLMNEQASSVTVGIWDRSRVTPRSRFNRVFQFSTMMDHHQWMGSQPQLSSFSTLPLFTFNSHRSVFEYSSLITHQIFRSCNYIRSKRDRLFVPSAGFERARRVWRRVNPRLSITAKESAQRSNRAGKRAWDA